MVSEVQPNVSGALTSVRLAPRREQAGTAATSEYSELLSRATSFGLERLVPPSKSPPPTGQDRPLIVSDVPTIDDQMGFYPVVKTLANIVLSFRTETPLAIAVDGKWGSGKTSMLKMVEAQARMLDFNCIWLNAWALEQSEQLIAQVTQGLQEEIVRSGKGGSLSDKLINFVANAVVALLPNLPGGRTVSELVKLSRTQDKVVTDKSDVENVTKRLATVATTQGAFKQLVNALLGEDKISERRLLVFIDDLDRTLPDQVAEIMKNLKLILEMERCIFLLGMDVDIVADRIQRYYHPRTQEIAFAAENVSFALRGEGQTKAQNDAIEFGRNFLEKLVQITISVPELTRAGAVDYVRRVGFVEDVVEIVTWAPRNEITNPRRLKRYLNWLSVSLQLIMAAPDLPNGVDNAFALRALAIRHSFRPIYDLLLHSDSEVGIFWPEEEKSIDDDKNFAKYLAKIKSTNGLLPAFERFLWHSSLFSAR